MVRCNANELVYGLLDEQLFPRASNNPIQMPDIFSSDGLADFALANQNLIDSSKVKPRRAKAGFGSFNFIPFRAYRFDNIERTFGIPHPQGYCALVLALSEVWGDKAFIKLTSSTHSLFHASQRADRRVFVMHYGGQKRLQDRGQVTADLEVHADIKNCFGSIYTHEIERILTVETGGDAQLAKKFDKLTSYMKKKETNGVLVGPAATNIIVEIILSYIDLRLAEALKSRSKMVLGYDFNTDFKMMRAVDDYTFYCSDHTEARFILDTLNETLKLSSLELNHGKTKILETPTGISDSWMFDVYTLLDSLKAAEDLTRACDKLLQIASNNKDKSVLNYGYRILANYVFSSPSTVEKVLMISVLELNLMKVARRYPAHLGLLELVYQNQIIPKSNSVERKKFLEEMFELGFRRMNSGTMTWCLYLAAKLGLKIETNKEQWERLIELGDGVTLTMIYYHLGVHKRASASFSRFLKKTMKEQEIDDLDALWLLFYQMFFEGSIRDTELSDYNLDLSTSMRMFTERFFRELRLAKISFVKVDMQKSKASGFLNNQ